MADEIDLEPDVAEVLQVENGYELPPYEIPVTPVCVKDVVRVQALPRKSAAARTVAISGSAPYRILAADPHRASAILRCSGGEMAVGFTQSSFSEEDDNFTSCVVWPIDVPLPITAVTEIWVRSAEVDFTAITVSLVRENWADG